MINQLEEYKQKLKDDILKCGELRDKYIKEQFTFDCISDCLSKKDYKTNKASLSQKLNAIRLYIDELNKELHRIELNERYKEVVWND